MITDYRGWVALKSYHRLHVFEWDLLPQHHLVERSDEKPCKTATLCTWVAKNFQNAGIRRPVAHRPAVFHGTRPFLPRVRWTWSRRGDPRCRGPSWGWSGGCSCPCRDEADSVREPLVSPNEQECKRRDEREETQQVRHKNKEKKWLNAKQI